MDEKVAGRVDENNTQNEGAGRRRGRGRIDDFQEGDLGHAHRPALCPAPCHTLMDKYNFKSNSSKDDKLKCALLFPSI